MQIAFADRSNCLGEPVASPASPRSEANQWGVGSQWGAAANDTVARKGALARYVK